MEKKSTLTICRPLAAAAALAVALAAPRALGADDPIEYPAPDAPDAPEAPKWDPGSPAKMPSYRWPADFKLLLEIVIRDLPDVPEEIQGPSPPIEPEKPSEKKKKKKGWLRGLFGS